VAVSAEQLARELRAFSDRRKVVQALRRGLTRQARPLVVKIRAHAADVLPSGGGLNQWVARARIGVKISYAARTAGIRLRGGRKSVSDRSDLAAIDRGQVRHPSWGRRAAGAWHTQSVTPGWWSDPTEAHGAAFVAAVDTEVDAVLDEIRG
jgi:hypothetical protein